MDIDEALHELSVVIILKRSISRTRNALGNTGQFASRNAISLRSDHHNTQFDGGNDDSAHLLYVHLGDDNSLQSIATELGSGIGHPIP